MEGRSRGRYWVWAAPLVLLTVPVLYVASLGPCVWLHMHGWINELMAQAANAFYEPLSLVADHSAAFDRFLEWYVGICEKLPP